MVAAIRRMRGSRERRSSDDHVLAHGRAGEPGPVGLAVQGGLKRVDRREIELGVAPLQHGDVVEPVRLQRLDQLLLEGRAAAGGAERAVVGVAAGAAGDLGELGGVEAAVLPAVELAVAGEGDVVDVEVEAHADRVGGDDEVDLAGLVHFDLRVAGARRERAENDGGAAALAADQLRDGVDLLGARTPRWRCAGAGGRACARPRR